MERFFRSLKTEWVPTKGYSNFADAKEEVTGYIIRYYNQTRPHHYNAGISPNESERRYWLVHETVAKLT